MLQIFLLFFSHLSQIDAHQTMYVDSQLTCATGRQMEERSQQRRVRVETNDSRDSNVAALQGAAMSQT